MLKVRFLNSQRLTKAALSMALFVCSTAAMAQNQVTGVIRDAQGEPLVGVSVVEAGTQNGVVTDIDGRYTLNVKRGAKLNVSYVGFEPQTITAGQSITLQEDNQLLNEVVVVGYGTMKRKDVTSSITTVQAKDLNKGVFSDPASMLQGKVAGLVVTSSGDPNGTPSITLRGASSLREGAAMQPYYVIDGIPGVDISMVAPDDIESIDVLRDASATAIYGSKAANGVIIITTKSGAEGRTNVTYNGYVAFDNILKNLEMATADDIRGYVKANNLTYDYDQGSNTDWQDEVLRTAVSHNHNVSINGGTGKTKYMGSVNYSDRQGVVRGTDMNRLNVRSMLSTSVLKDHLDLSIGVNAMYGKHTGVRMNDTTGESVLDAMNYFNPTIPVRDADGNWSVGSGSSNYNPMSLINEDTSETIWKRNQFVGKAALHIVDGLTLNANYSFNHRQSTYSAYDSHNTQLAGISSYNGQATRSTYFGNDQTFETYLNFDHTFADVHKLALMAGYSWEERESNDGFGLTVHSFFDDYLKWNQLTYAGAIDGMPAVQSGTKETIRNISYYGRVSYSYASRYMLQATVRRDGSSVFGDGHRWGTFPSVSAAWNIAEEPFMKNQNTFDNLKLRAGYGVSGNALGFGAYTPVATYGRPDAPTYFDYKGSPYVSLAATKLANPDLKWESTAMVNVGLDFGFLRNRINGTLEFYHKKTKDLIWNYPVSTVIYPFDNIAANVGEITNKGVELTINIDAIRTKSFNWMTTINLAHNKNTVDKLSNDKYSVGTFDQGDPKVAGVSANGFTQRVIEGEPLGTFYTYEFAGYNSEGKATYYVHDEETGERTGEVTSEPAYKDRTITGNAQPKLNFGWNNTFTFKNWSLTAFITGVLGNKIYNGARAHYTSRDFFDGGKNVLKEFITDRPASDNLSNIPSDRFIEKGDYLRLSTLSLGYTFDKLGGWAESLQLYATCNNVFTITGYKGLDPEVNMGGISPGVDYRYYHYPHTRTVMVGVKVNFDASTKKAPARTVYVTDNAEVDRLNGEINRLRDENSQLRNRKPENTKEVINTKEYVTYPYLVTFTLGKAEITNQEKVNLEGIAKMIKNTPNVKFRVAGYADKGTGSEEINNQLAKNRAQNVYDLLTRVYGVPASRLTVESNGGVDNMYLDDPRLSRSVIISEVK